MDTGYKIRNPFGLYYLTFTVVDWVDIFSRKCYRDILISSMDYCRKQKLLSIWAYVIMTNHMHCILSAKNGNLPNLIRDFKRFTATQILKSTDDVPESRRDWMLKRFEFASRKNARNSDHQFWLHENHPMELTSAKFINQKLNYIHNNPVKAGWVEDPSDWMYSSQRNYSNLSFLLEIDLLDVSPPLYSFIKSEI